MKFKLLSDLHLEFYTEGWVWKPKQHREDPNTILLLAGDIHVGGKAEPWIKEMCERFYHVVYILGNHEFYGQTWHGVKKHWANLDMPDNFTFLDDDTVVIDGVRIIGGTLWTAIKDQTDDFAFTMWRGRQAMYDYAATSIVRVPGMKAERLTPQDTIGAHETTVKYIIKKLQEPFEGRTIVMTHHMPHEACIHPKYVGDWLNPFFITHLDDIIKTYDIAYWVHGHTHEKVDEIVHGTRILCNPKGYYGYEVNKDFMEGLVFNVATDKPKVATTL
jgi:predicted phosphodiesterase